ncbi:RING-H2 finger protein ATL1-like [Chenopodium quinoa]|uniref:RING-H2 finger protein ATL1-like n=1 Tax=Chenopodium quinoa TaxID=63459 RepID=UPI000B77A634|nr:RING-H2 finger protein ATL1-like [Chenopodium quinoa]
MEPPPPPPLSLSPSPPVLHIHHPGNNSFPVIAIAVIGILAIALLLFSYYIFVIKCCLTWHRVDIFNRFFSRVRDPSTDTASLTTPTLSPDGNTAVQKGLDEALIRSIPVIEFRKLVTERKQHEHDIVTSVEPAASYECSVCLSEFEEGERLRVIPYCCHAFHIDCIDVWLQSNANCPLCRSGISPASILYNTQQHLIHFPPPFQPQKPSNDDDNDSDNDNDTDDDDDFVVIEIQGNNLDEPRLVTSGESRKGRKKLGHVYSLGDELIDMRKKDEEFEVVQPIRRSISMDLSKEREYCFEIRECCRSNMEVSEVSSSSSNSKVRRSIFSFGYGRSSSSRCSVQPVHLDP